MGSSVLRPAYAVSDDTSITLALEGHNPTGSIKDRLATHRLVDGTASGRLRPGRVIVETTGGNGAVALARVASLLGHPCEVLLRETVDSALLDRIRAYGGQPVLLPGDIAAEDVTRLVRERVAHGCFWPAELTAPRIALAFAALTEDVVRAVPHVDCVLSGVGSGATLLGVGLQLLRLRRDRVHLVGVEPAVGQTIEGLRERPAHPPTLAHHVIPICELQAQQGSRWLAVQGVQGGRSSGAVYFAALMAARGGRYRHIVAICSDARLVNPMIGEEK